MFYSLIFNLESDACGSMSVEHTATFTFPGVCESDMFAVDPITMIPVASTSDANAFTEDESAVVTRCSSNTSASGSSSCSLGGSSPTPPMPTPPRSSSGSLMGSTSDSEGGSPPRQLQLSPQYFHAKDSPHSVPSDDCKLPLIFDDPVLSVAATSTPAHTPSAHTVLRLVQPQPMDTSSTSTCASGVAVAAGSGHSTAGVGAAPTRYLLVQQAPMATVPRIVAFCNPAAPATAVPAGGLPPTSSIAKTKLIVAPATVNATSNASGATCVTGSVVAPVPQMQKKASGKGKPRVSPTVCICPLPSVLLIRFDPLTLVIPNPMPSNLIYCIARAHVHCSRYCAGFSCVLLGTLDTHTRTPLCH